MDIYLAENSGFCFGVKRAMKIVYNSIEKYNELYTLGPLIHNPQMVEKLKKNNIFPVDIDEKYDKKYPVIIRSHGITSDLQEKLKKENVHLIDATCPKVKIAQKYIEKLTEEDYQIMIIGDENHPEVVGLISYAKGKEIITIKDKGDIPNKSYNKVGIVVQTTFNIVILKDIISELINKIRELRLFNTVCDATSIRQHNTVQLAKKVDLMLVIGGKNSSNTKALAALSQEFTTVYHIEDKSELQDNWFKKKKTIGLTAGASTPDWIIIDIYNELIERIKYPGKKISNVGSIPKI